MNTNVESRLQHYVPGVFGRVWYKHYNCRPSPLWLNYTAPLLFLAFPFNRLRLTNAMTGLRDGTLLINSKVLVIKTEVPLGT